MEISDKSKYYIKLFIMTAAVYFSLKYLLPMFLPFIFAYFLSWCIKPITVFLNQRCRVNKKISTIILLGIIVSVLVIGIGSVVNVAMKQVRNLCSNYGKYEKKLDDITDKTCNMLERYSGVDSDEIKIYVNKGIDTVSDIGMSADTVSIVMNKSIDTVIVIGEIFVFILTMIISSYYILNGKEKKRPSHRQPILYQDIRHLSSRVGRVCVAYVKTQLIIMAITSIVCFIGFMLIKSNYAVLLALVVGFLDALPLIGIGIILIPCGIIYLIMGSYVKAVIIFVTFAICYLVREFLEPRLMGHQIGITPLATIMSMYVGYQVFGIIGVILGPVGYILLKTLMEESEEK